MTPFVVGGLVAVVLAAAVAAVAISSTSPSGRSEPAGQTVTIIGDHLPPLTDPTADPAVGLQVPRISGVGLDGQPMEIGPEDGPVAIVVLAHWCPHCQAELPGLAGYLARGSLPGGVSVVGVSTAIDPARPNYPPSEWFGRVGWAQRTLTDDADSTALGALGLNSFPGFVFVAADGTVERRLTGEIGVDQFAQILASLAP